MRSLQSELSRFRERIMSYEDLGIVSKVPPAGVVKPAHVTKGKDGIHLPQWFWAASDGMLPSGAADEKPAGTESAPGTVLQTDTVTPEDELAKVIATTPGMNAATLLNYIKSKGWQVGPLPNADKPEVQPNKEADAASSNPAVQREAQLLGRSSFHFHEKLRTLSESNYKDNGIGPTRFRVILLQEGLGNLRDQYYYTRAALESAVPVFEGRKIFADHPSSQEEESRPERSVRDVLGHFENIGLEEGEDKRGLLCGDVVVLPDKPYEWARGLMRHAVDFSKKYPDKDFVGLSINASGDAQESSIQPVLESAPESAKVKLRQAMEEGVESVKLVTAITEATSCDLVTEAGAGGRILTIMESNKEKKMKQNEGKKEGADAGHADEQQDIELVKKMLAKYMGDGGHDDKDVEEAHGLMKQIAEKHGMEKETAAHMAAVMRKESKDREAMESKEGETKEGGEAETKEGFPPKKKGAGDDSTDSDKDDDEAQAESKEGESKEKKEASENKESVAKLKGELAALREKDAKRERADHLDKLLRESGLSMSVTKEFRKLVEGAKSAKDIDGQWKLFQEGIKAGRGGEATGTLEDLFTMPEKGESFTESKGEAVTSFADCVVE